MGLLFAVRRTILRHAVPVWASMMRANVILGKASGRQQELREASVLVFVATVDLIGLDGGVTIAGETLGRKGGQDILLTALLEPPTVAQPAAPFRVEAPSFIPADVAATAATGTSGGFVHLPTLEEEDEAEEVQEEEETDRAVRKEHKDAMPQVANANRYRCTHFQNRSKRNYGLRLCHAGGTQEAFSREQLSPADEM